MMSPVEQDPIDRFDAALDALARGEPVRPDAADPDLVASVRRLRALDAAQKPAPGLADYIWEEVVNQTGLKDAPALPPAGPPAAPSLNGSAAPRPWRARVTTLPVLGHRRWPLTQLAAAAVLVLFLAGSLLIVRFAGGGGPRRCSWRQESPGSRRCSMSLSRERRMTGLRSRSSAGRCNRARRR